MKCNVLEIEIGAQRRGHPSTAKLPHVLQTLVYWYRHTCHMHSYILYTKRLWYSTVTNRVLSEEEEVRDSVDAEERFRKTWEDVTFSELALVELCWTIPRCDDVFRKFYIDDLHETLVESSLVLVSHGWPTSSHKHLIDVMLIGPIGYKQHTHMNFFPCFLEQAMNHQSTMLLCRIRWMDTAYLISRAEHLLHSGSSKDENANALNFLVNEIGR